jgi:Helicase conserved C-terminal domain
MHYMLIGPLTWLGLVEWAGDGHYLRRTPLGAWHAGVAVAPRVVAPQAAVLEPDFCVVVPDFTNFYARFQLHRIADWQDAVTAQISPARVKRAIALGMTVPEYSDVLATITAQPVPVAMQTMLRRWGADVAQITLSNVVILSSSDASAMQDIQHDRRVHLPAHEVLDGTRIALQPSDAIGVARRLRQAGYLIDTQQLRPGQFDDAELAIIDAALHQLPAASEAVRTLRRRIAQMRTPAGDTHG